MLHSILQFKRIIIREIMTPRTEIAALDKNSTIEDVLRIANTEKYSRIPVYEESIDNVRPFEILGQKVRVHRSDRYMQKAIFCARNKKHRRAFQGIQKKKDTYGDRNR